MYLRKSYAKCPPDYEKKKENLKKEDENQNAKKTPFELWKMGGRE